MGQVFFLSFTACLLFSFVIDIFADYDSIQILQKHFFLVMILRTAKKNKREFILQFRHVWWLHVSCASSFTSASRDVSITKAAGLETRNPPHIFHLHFANFVKSDDRSMMDWKMIAAKYIYGWSSWRKNEKHNDQIPVEDFLMSWKTLYRGIVLKV